MEVPSASVAFVHCSRSVCVKRFSSTDTVLSFFPPRNKCAIIILGHELPNDQKFSYCYNAGALVELVFYSTYFVQEGWFVFQQIKEIETKS